MRCRTSVPRMLCTNPIGVFNEQPELSNDLLLVHQLYTFFKKLVFFSATLAP